MIPTLGQTYFLDGAGNKLPDADVDAGNLVFHDYELLEPNPAIVQEALNDYENGNCETIDEVIDGL